MKIATVIALVITALRSPALAEADFQWSQPNDTKVRLGVRTMVSKAWTAQMLTIQCAVRNDGERACYIPVVAEGACLSIRNLTIKIETLRDGDDPFAERAPLSFLQTAMLSDGPHLVFDAKRLYVRLDPGEEFLSTATSGEVGSTPIIKMTVIVRWETKPLESPYYGVEVPKEAKLRLNSFEAPKEVKSPHIVIGSWTVAMPQNFPKD